MSYNPAIGSKIATSNDVALTSLQTGQLLTYNQSTNKWVNLAAPVISVAGKTGAVTLAEADIANLTSDLASKISFPTTAPTAVGQILAITSLSPLRVGWITPT